MAKPHQNYAFGTFEERLTHACALLEIEPFPFEYNDHGEPALSDGLITWCKQNGISMNWLFLGSPSEIVKRYADQSQQNARYFAMLGQMEPEIQTALYVALKAARTHELPLQEVLATLDQAIRDHRGATAGLQSA